MSTENTKPDPAQPTGEDIVTYYVDWGLGRPPRDEAAKAAYAKFDADPNRGKYMDDIPGEFPG